MKWISFGYIARVPLWPALLLPLTINVLSCRSSPKSPRSAVPESVRSGSFKLSMDSSKGAEPQILQLLNKHSSEIAAAQGCTVHSVEAISWETGAISSELVSSYHVQLGNCTIDDEKTREVLRSFEEKEGVTSVEADAIVSVSVAENDPYKANQYHLARVNREAACNALGGGKGQEVVVAVIDSGVDMNHPDLAASFYRGGNGAIVGANFVGKGARNPPDGNWNDSNGHGTHVAGLIGASANNSQGGVGVASCSNVKIMPVRVMGNDGAGNMVEVERGVQWAIAQGADVINLSLGGTVYLGQKTSSHPSALYSEAAARGILVFAASGNESTRLGSATDFGYVYSYPASFDGVISVAATDGADKLVSFSNRGDTVDIAAPGYQDLSTLVGGGYGVMSGTSMASPVAAGAYALALSSVRQSRQERISPKKALPHIMKAVRTQSLARSDVGSGGVIDTLMLVNLLKSELDASRQAPLPAGPPPSPNFPEQTEAVSLKFEGLIENQQIQQAIKVSVSGWPKGQTTAIYLYWRAGQGATGSTFAILTADNLSADGRLVITDQTYYFIGSGTLTAEAIDVRGQRNGLASIKLRGF